MPFFRRPKTGDGQQRSSGKRSGPVTSSIRAKRTFGTPASILSRTGPSSSSTSLSEDELIRAVENHLAGFDKRKWGVGPWLNEPDEYYVLHYDIPCYARRHETSGSWCGYIELPDSHPWSGLSQEEVPAEAHGGITFAGRRSAMGDGWFIGFDCGHGGDVSPAMDARLKGLGLGSVGSPTDTPQNWEPTYKTLYYVLKELRELARQAKDAAAR